VVSIGLARYEAAFASDLAPAAARSLRPIGSDDRRDNKKRGTAFGVRGFAQWRGCCLRKGKTITPKRANSWIKLIERLRR